VLIFFNLHRPKLTTHPPFSQVYLHSMVRDAHGRKMSKSLGNVLDPVAVMEGVTLAQLAAGLEGGNLDAKEVAKARAGQAADFPEGIEECGADALRFALVAYTGQGAGSINLDINRVVAYRHWCNKLWNAIRFAMLNLGTDFIPSERVDAAALPFAARWILSRLSGAAAAAGAAMERYEFSAATTAVYAFWQYDLCDVYIELAKALFADGAEPSAAAGARDALWLCLDAGLRLLHPFMPFVTEELWQRLPRRAGAAAPASIMLADYPARVEAWDDAVLEGEMAFVQAVVGRVRGLRSEYDLTPRHRPPLYLSSRDTGRGAVLAARAAEIAHLAGCAGAEALAAGAAPPRGCGVAVVDEATTAHLGLAGVLDAAKELEKLAKREGEAAARAEALERKAAGADYLAKTPAEVRAADADKLAKARAEVEEVRRHAGEMRALLEG
jgi:valyl-tRNA synthetase